MTDVAARVAADELWRSMFAVRIANCLVEAGIYTPERLSWIRDAELLRLPNFGRAALAEVRAVFPEPAFCPTCHGSGLVKQ